MSFARNSSIDTIIYEGAPGTLYTASTTLEVGMTLYNNEGIAYEEYKVGEVLTPNSFNLLSIYRLNVEDYNYTSDASYNIVLTEYIGSNTAVIAPELEN